MPLLGLNARAKAMHLSLFPRFFALTMMREDFSSIFPASPEHPQCLKLAKKSRK